MVLEIAALVLRATGKPASFRFCRDEDGVVLDIKFTGDQTLSIVMSHAQYHALGAAHNDTDNSMCIDGAWFGDV